MADTRDLPLGTSQVGDRHLNFHETRDNLLTGPDGLLKQFTKNVLETALNEEMTEHLGHEKNRASGDRDSSNGISRGSFAQPPLPVVTPYGLAYF